MLKLCGRGHPLAGENVYEYRRRDGGKARYCKECYRFRYRARTKERHARRLLTPPRADDPQRLQKLGVWGHEPGWLWVSFEMLDAKCLHQRQVIHPIFHGRKVNVLICRMCKRRVMLRRMVGRPCKTPPRADVIIPVPKGPVRRW